MKTLVLLTLILICFNASSQSLSFNNPTLKSGNKLKKGAVYTFNDVTTGVNAEVTITDLVNNASINTIDDNTDGTGYLHAFQPEIKSGNSGESYAIFTVRFFEKTSGSLYLLKSLQATALDIDGTSQLKEFDEIDMRGGKASFMGTSQEISMKALTGIAGNKYRADNTTGNDKNGIDTSSKANMFTVSNANVNTVVFKLGATKTTNSSIDRQYSIYMIGFQYPNLTMLPLKLLSFTATAKNSKANLTWTTTSENNMASIIVERSIDGANYTTAGSVAPKGNMTAVTTYSFNDNLVAASKIYYRLRFVDLDGGFTYSTIEAVRATATSTAASVSAYPNPFTSTLTIQLPSSLDGKHAKIEFFSNNGQLVKTKTATAGGNETLETSTLGRGIYIVRVTSENQTTQYKVVKS